MSHQLAFRPSAKLIKLYAVLFAIIIIAGRILSHAVPHNLMIWGVVLLIGGIWLFYLYLVRATSLYTIDENHLTSSVGIFAKRATKIPINRITNYEVHHTFFERVLGLGDINVDTAGSTEFELKMAEVDRQDIDIVVRTLDQLLAEQNLAEVPAQDSVE